MNSDNRTALAVEMIPKEPVAYLSALATLAQVLILDTKEEANNTKPILEAISDQYRTSSLPLSPILGACAEFILMLEETEGKVL